MDFLAVSDSKLKIMMSREEMKRYAIDGEDIDYDNPKVRRSFWKILDEAKQVCGFDVGGDKVLIQFYPAKDGCEIFVTKLGIVSASTERTISKSSRVAMLCSRRSAYKFHSFSAMREALKIIEREEKESSAAVLFDDNGAYYLIAEEKRLGRSSEISPVFEYGREVPDNLIPYISEHATELDIELVRKM